MKIRWIGQSGYEIKTEQAKILIDPYLSDVVNRVSGRARMVEAPIDPKEIHVDAVICTHDHMDHLDPDAVLEMDREQFFITTYEGVEKLKTLQHENSKAVKEGDCLTINDVEITAVHALHSVEAFGVILKAEGYTLYFSGDTLYDEKLFEIAGYQPDVTFICINGRLGNMNVEEALVTAGKIGAKVNVPAHYGMFASNTEDPAKFTGRLSNGFEMEFDKEYEIKELFQEGYVCQEEKSF